MDERTASRQSMNPEVDARKLFDGPGEMRARCREFDWSATGFGPVSAWPQSLQTIAGMVLASGFSKILLWGPYLLQIYNDAYIPFLGTKHPSALGVPTRECWPEMWHFNEPIFERVLRGETIFLENQLYTLARRGPGMPLDEVYITLSYSPIRDETGGVGGVLVTAIDTTIQVTSERLREERDRLHRQIEAERAQLRAAWDRAPSFMATLRGPEFVFEQVNDAYYQLVGNRELIGKPVWEALPEIRGQGFEQLLAQVVETGEPFVGREIRLTLNRLAGAPPEETFVDFVYAPLLDADGRPNGVFAHGSDVTDHVRARQMVERLLAESEEGRQALSDANAQLQDQTIELELTNQRLQENASMLEMQTEELQSTASLLEERTEEAEAARRTVTAIVEAVTDGFVAFDANLHYTYVNQRAAEMWRISADELVGKNPDELWPAMGASPFVRMLRRVLASGTPEILEGYASSLGCYIEMRVYPASGGGLVAFFADVTGRRRAQEAARFTAEASELLVSSTDFQTTLGNLAMAAVPQLGDWCAVDVILEPDSPVWPPKIERLAVVHQDPAKVTLAQSLTTRFPQDWSRDVGTPGVLRTREPMFVPYVTEAMLTAGAQSEAHAEMLRALHIRSIIIVPLVARDRVLGAVTLVMAESERHFTNTDLAIAIDLGQRAGAALDNARLLRDAQDANAAKSQFLANMSHELRQPLNAITGYADLITMGVRGPVTDQQQEDLDRIKSSSTHLTSLIGDILDFAKIEAGRLLYNEADVPLDATLREVASFVEPQVRAKQITFVLEPCQPDVAVRADHDRLVQAVLNLLTNATKYTPDGGSITVSCAIVGAEQQAIAIHVADTGIGIPNDKLPTIFEPFVQVNRSLHRPAEGVGLGLAIARDIARHMGGDLTVESEEGVGSTFTLTLQRA
jgi:PAS domain S-box-containing protein